MDSETQKKLTAKERKIIEAIEEKASKRKHVREYTPKFIVDYMLESYHDFTYDSKEDAYDMMEAIFVVAKKCGVMTDKQIKKERRYMEKEYIKIWFEDDE